MESTNAVPHTKASRGMRHTASSCFRFSFDAVPPSSGSIAWANMPLDGHTSSKTLPSGKSHFTSYTTTSLTAPYSPPGARVRGVFVGPSWCKHPINRRRAI